MTDEEAIKESPLGALKTEYRIERKGEWYVLTIWIQNGRTGSINALPEELVLLDLIVYALAGNGATERK